MKRRVAAKILNGDLETGRSRRGDTFARAVKKFRPHYKYAEIPTNSRLRGYLTAGMTAAFIRHRCSLRELRFMLHGQAAMRRIAEIGNRELAG